MRTRIALLIIACLAGATNSGAQTNYYDRTKVIPMDGYTYKCDVLGDIDVTLYNAQNKFTHTLWANRDGSPIKDGVHFGEIPTIQPDALDIQSCNEAMRIVADGFTEEQKKMIGRDLMSVRVYIDPDTGKAMEVVFRFLNITGYAHIPVETYRKMELALKEAIRYNITEEGKKLNFCIFGWNHRFETMRPSLKEHTLIPF